MNDVSSSMDEIKNIGKKIVRPQTLLLGIFFLVGLSIGNFFPLLKDGTRDESFRLLRPAAASYKFIKPLVGVDITTDQNFPEFKNIKNIITQFIERQFQEKKAALVSVYVRNADNAHWFGINEEEKFQPGSLLKVPIMMAYLKASEARPELKSKKIVYHGSDKRLPNELQTTLTEGQSYTVSELIITMIVKSDNEAKDLLLDYLDPDYLGEVYSDLGIPLPSSISDGISPRVYGRFFRRLYNATFLSRQSSEEAMQLLTETDFTKGIVAGVPLSIDVAHKYGERGIYKTDERADMVEFHDCGFVYISTSPYFLCIMTRGYSTDDLGAIIQQISFLVYQNMTSTHEHLP